MYKNCPIGIDCSLMAGCFPCPNHNTCLLWAKPWRIPYKYDRKRKILRVFFDDVYFFQTEELTKLGWKKSIPLPYKYYGDEKKLVVKLSKYFPTNFDEILESGFREAEPLNYHTVTTKSFQFYIASRSVYIDKLTWVRGFYLLDQQETRFVMWFLSQELPFNEWQHLFGLGDALIIKKTSLNSIRNVYENATAILPTKNVGSCGGFANCKNSDVSFTLKNIYSEEQAEIPW